MKRLIFFLVLVLAFSGCSEFHQLHYRHVKKVPAKGFVEKISADEKNIAAKGKALEQVDSLKSNEAEVLNEKPDAVILPMDNNPGYYLPPILEKRTANPAPFKKIIRDKLKLKKPILHRKGGDGSVFLIVVFLFLGVCLMLIGGSIFVGAFYGFSIWMLLLGLVIFLLGLLPFLGLLSFAFGGGNNHNHPKWQERK
jgi:hypothetical protein